MPIFHINPETGEARPCASRQDRCPFGSADTHFGTAEEARAAYEQTQGSAFEKLKWTQTARGWERGSYVVAPHPRVKGWAIYELAEIKGKMVMDKIVRTESSLKGARALAVELEDLKASDAQAHAKQEEDLAYRRNRRAEALAEVDTMLAEVDKLMDSSSNRMKKSQRALNRTPEEQARARTYHRNNILDTIEGDKGEPLDDDTVITVGEHVGTAEELGARLEPLLYEGTYLNPKTGQREIAFVSVHGEGAPRAYGRDLRKDDEYRARVSAAKPAELAVAKTEFEDAMAEAKSEEETLAYGEAAALMAQISKDTDWSDPVKGSLSLDRADDLIERCWDRTREDKRNEAPYYKAIADRLHEVTYDSYAMRGVQKLRPMKNV